MTREEAIKFAEHAVNMTDIPEVKEFYRLYTSALRPVSRRERRIHMSKWENKNRVHIILKNGVQFTVVCDEFTCKHSRNTGELLSCSWKGAAANIPLYIRVDDVSAIFMEKPNTEEEK